MTRETLRAAANGGSHLKDELWDIMAPIIDILWLKEVSIERKAMMLERYALWNAETLHGLDPVAIDRYDQEGILLQVRLEEADAWTSFSSRDNPSEWRMASGYSERLVSSVAGEFNYYFVCMAGGPANTCWTMISSKNWIQYHVDPIANGQRWYCKVCGARYMRSFGVLIEIVQPQHAARYMMAEYPPSSIGDVRAMALEREHDSATTPAALFAAVPNVVPASKFHLQLIDPGIYSIISQDELLACGFFNWAQMFNLKPTKAEQKNHQQSCLIP